MAHPSEPFTPGARSQRHHLELCWQLDCDIDPLILRVRWLRRQRAGRQAACLEEEMLPLF
ncbi:MULTISPECIES: hypothetical protein [Aphanothece]|uniref:hypothetical protein n=1 Tax=Aphanothece TaxID=1121 RepID=UPI003985141E